jgi:copper chaperone CopZ
MKTTLLSVSLLLFAIGCGQSQSAPNSDTPAAAANAEAAPASSAAGDAGLVTLSLPNMTCPICAKEVQADLAKLDGVSEIETDVKGTSCRFKLADQELDLESKLEELATSNESLKGFKVVKK